MNAREHSRVKWSVESWVIYSAAVIDFVLFIICFSAPITATINAIRTSSLILAVILGMITLLRQRRSLLCWRKAASVATAINVVVDASVFFTIAVLLGLGHRLSFAVAIGIIMLLPPVMIIPSIFLHRRSKKPSQVAIGILMFLGFGAGGAFLIYTAPSFNLAAPFNSMWLAAAAANGGVMGMLPGIVGRLDRHRLGQGIAHRNAENAAPRAG